MSGPELHAHHVIDAESAHTADTSRLDTDQRVPRTHQARADLLPEAQDSIASLRTEASDERRSMTDEPWELQNPAQPVDARWTTGAE